MRNHVIKAQREASPNRWLSGLRLTPRSGPFDTMPFCTALAGHVPKSSDLFESLPAAGRSHELLARRVRTNVEQGGTIYTMETAVSGLGDLDALIARYNDSLPPTDRHAPRRLVRDKGHVFIAGYEDDTVAIIEKLQACTGQGVSRHREGVARWLDSGAHAVDDPLKAQALSALFAHSSVALIYGAAGTGKSTMVNHLAHYFSEATKVFLAHTNPAVENLERRVDAPNSTFSTITRHLARAAVTGTVDVLVIDECSFVDNATLLKVLTSTTFDLLVLVGDVYQIESIQFGNWFSLARTYVPPESVFELTKLYRTDDLDLQTLWDRVRSLDDRIEESLSKHGYTAPLGPALFEHHGADEIVLCLNYEGLYGINNINRFLQARNPSPPVQWGEALYKIGDPVLFTETDRFRPLIHNNTKGRIAGIRKGRGHITFDVDLARPVTAFECAMSGLRRAGESVVTFDVVERPDTDNDDDDATTLVPFQVAYAVSVHKAQGLEYDSVKVVVTDQNEERLSHSIFYTAITRARRHLRIFWTPETQHRVLSRLAVREARKDESLLRERRGLVRLGVPPGRRPGRAPV